MKTKIINYIKSILGIKEADPAEEAALQEEKQLRNVLYSLHSMLIDVEGSIEIDLRDKNLLPYWKVLKKEENLAILTQFGYTIRVSKGTERHIVEISRKKDER